MYISALTLSIQCAAQVPRHTRKGLPFRIIKISHIKEVMSIDSTLASSSAPDDYLPLRPVNIPRLEAREAEGIRHLKQRVARMGVGVTKEAQDIFDALSKT